MPIINILFHQSFSANFYGSQHSLYYLLERLDKSRFTPFVVCPEEGVFVEKVRELGIEVIILASPKGWTTGGGVVRRTSAIQKIPYGFRLAPYISKLRHLIGNRNIHLIYCNGQRSMLACGWSAKLSKTPLIWQVRTDFSNMRFLSQLGYLLSNKIVFVSERVQTNYYQLPLFRLAPPHKMKVVYNGLPLEDFNPNKSDNRLRRAFNIKEDVIVVGVVASLTPRKGLDIFIEMAKKIRQNGFKAQFLIVGDTPDKNLSPYKQYLASLAADLTQDNSLIFTGWQDDMEGVYAAMDIFVLPSFSEGLPRTILEAMGMAKPVVATNIAGIPEVIQDSLTGYLVVPNDVDSLTTAVIRLIHNSDQRQKMGLAGRQRIVEHFTLDKVTRRMEQIFLETLSNQVQTPEMSAVR